MVLTLKKLIMLFCLIIISCNSVNIIAEPTLKDTELSKRKIDEGNNYIKNGNIEMAIKSFQEAISLDNLNAEAYYYLGDLYFNIIEMDKAQMLLLKAIELDPKLIRAHIDIGYIYLMAKNYDDAVKYFKNATKIDESFYYAHMSLGRAYYKKSLFKEAEAEFKKAIFYNPEDYFSFFILSLIYEKHGLSDKSEEYKNKYYKIIKEIDKKR